ncbi:flavin-containing monooxygenase FMO GS-OX-like 3 isoform X2 [Arachis hypogaea]|uniref:flavin-containing monooxygenase FMO GS-OX-like 3 isoform X2 n=1 Tax=Arachis hypogaea TaxID=3818 RepID=UPI000DEC68C8|nr:flavin-containing monooxygenase FMO GS-OX-like 3 isoform X2 [Arachis hypogaea]QHO32094.1 Flavin-containing monooxygenase FMO GS-OX-like [Arachis hypogaea]
MSRSVKVAVIGAGVSGLVAARELKREAHNVVVFEKSSRVGGTWLYNPKTESDPLSLDPTREIVHSSLYRSLRTNLPRPLMGFLDYPFRRVERGDPRTFPCHEEVLRFLEEFADEFGINELTRFETEVVKVKKVEEGWVVESRASYGGGDSVSQEVFDSVAVCSGHNVVPRVAEVSGIENWRGFQMHCHNYRVPQPFQGQVVILIGLGPTSFDISREIALVAKEVHVSVKLNPLMKGVKLEDFSNIKCINEDGLVVFEDEVTIYADSIIHCTGYKNQIAFLETNGVVTIDDNRVGPLYKHVFPPTLAPWLSFIGLTYLDPVFPIAELQAKWVARILSGKIVLPTEEEMMKSIQQHYQFMQENGLPKRFTHFLGSFQRDYKHWLAEQVGLPPLEDWRDAMYSHNIKSFFEMNGGFRDEWNDHYWDAIIKTKQLHS